MVHSLKKLLLGLAASLALLGAVPAAAASEQISAASAIVMEPRTGAVLYEKEPDERRLVASTTKIMTALVVLEHCALDEIVLPTAAHAGVEGSSMYLEAGTPYTVEELLYGLLLASGNDAAAALADHCAGLPTSCKKPIPIATSPVGTRFEGEEPDFVYAQTFLSSSEKYFIAASSPRSAIPPTAGSTKTTTAC